MGGLLVIGGEAFLPRGMSLNPFLHNIYIDNLGSLHHEP